MAQQFLYQQPLGDRCLKCGSEDITSMEKLSELVATSADQFAPDIAVWLVSPQTPKRMAPKKRRLAIRNSVAFGIALLFALSVSVFALTGSLPGWPIWVVIVTLALSVSARTWRTESKVVLEEEAMLLETHGELYRAFLNRKKIWSRLRYCCKCSVVTDPVTLQTRSLFEVHELANRRVNGVSLR